MKNYYLFLILIFIILFVIPFNSYAVSTTINTSDLEFTKPEWDDLEFLSNCSKDNIFYRVYPEANNSSEINGFINLYGISDVTETPAYKYNFRYKYVHVLPKNNCSVKLVFLDYHNIDGKNNSLIWVKLVNKNETFSMLNESEFRLIRITPNDTKSQEPTPLIIPSLFPSLGPSVNQSPGFSFNTLILIGFLLISSYLLSVIRKNEK